MLEPLLHASQPRINAASISELSGEFSLRPLIAEQDVALLHRWVSNERARFWGMQNETVEGVAAFYQQQIDSPHSWPYIGLFNGEAAFLLESYDPQHDELARHYPVQKGDRGMHFLIAPASGPRIHGFSHAVLTTILSFLFADPSVQRVVVEPDVQNDKIHPLNRAMGFAYQHTITLPTKTAWLAFCQREDFQAALNQPERDV